MSFDFSSVKTAKTGIEDWLKQEYKSFSTGRASPVILDNVAILQYGARTSLAHTASITVEDPKTLRVAPWDKSVVKDIEKAIYDADLGLSVSTDNEGLRVHFPMLTTETRAKMVKVLKEKLEESRVRVRALREETNKAIDQEAKDGAFGDDDKKRYRDEMQKITDEANTSLEAIFHTKEKEVMGE